MSTYNVHDRSKYGDNAVLSNCQRRGKHKVSEGNVENDEGANNKYSREDSHFRELKSFRRIGIGM